MTLFIEVIKFYDIVLLQKDGFLYRQLVYGNMGKQP